MAQVPTVEQTTFDSDIEALQADYNTAKGDGSYDQTHETYAELAEELGTTITALEEARVSREVEAGRRAADLLSTARENDLLDDQEDPDTWRKRKED